MKKINFFYKLFALGNIGNIFFSIKIEKVPTDFKKKMFENKSKKLKTSQNHHWKNIIPIKKTKKQFPVKKNNKQSNNGLWIKRIIIGGVIIIIGIIFNKTTRFNVGNFLKLFRKSNPIHFQQEASRIIEPTQSTNNQDNNIQLNQHINNNIQQEKSRIIESTQSTNNQDNNIQLNQQIDNDDAMEEELTNELENKEINDILIKLGINPLKPNEKLEYINYLEDHNHTIDDHNIFINKVSDFITTNILKELLSNLLLKNNESIKNNNFFNYFIETCSTKQTIDYNMIRLRITCWLDKMQLIPKSKQKNFITSDFFQSINNIIYDYHLFTVVRYIVSENIHDFKDVSLEKFNILQNDIINDFMIINDWLVDYLLDTNNILLTSETIYENIKNKITTSKDLKYITYKKLNYELFQPNFDFFYFCSHYSTVIETYNKYNKQS